MEERIRKTAKEWSNNLPLDIKSKFLSYLSSSEEIYMRYDLYSVINIIHWGDTTEGHDYWSNIAQRAGQGVFDSIFSECNDDYLLIL